MCADRGSCFFLETRADILPGTCPDPGKKEQQNGNIMKEGTARPARFRPLARLQIFTVFASAKTLQSVAPTGGMSQKNDQEEQQYCKRMLKNSRRILVTS